MKKNRFINLFSLVVAFGGIVLTGCNVGGTSSESGNSSSVASSSSEAVSVSSSESSQVAASSSNSNVASSVESSDASSSIVSSEVSSEASSEASSSIVSSEVSSSIASSEASSSESASQVKTAVGTWKGDLIGYDEAEELNYDDISDVTIVFNEDLSGSYQGKSVTWTLMSSGELAGAYRFFEDSYDVYFKYVENDDQISVKWRNFEGEDTKSGIFSRVE